MTELSRIPIDADGNEQRVGCCPSEERIEDIETRQGDRVVDLHKHKGLLKGLVMFEAGKKTLFFYRNGRLSRGSENPLDLRRVG